MGILQALRAKKEINLKEIRAQKIATHRKLKSELEAFAPGSKDPAKDQAEIKLWRLEETSELPIYIEYYDTIVIRSLDSRSNDLILGSTNQRYYLVDFDTIVSPSFNCTRNEIHIPPEAINLSGIVRFNMLSLEQVTEELRTLVNKLLDEQNPKTWSELKAQIEKHYFPSKS